jgi:hypothetical protein
MGQPDSHGSSGGPNQGVIIAVAVIGGLAVISAIGLFFFLKKRRAKKKENMANAFFEFSVDKPDDKISRVSPIKKKLESTPDSYS